MRGLHFSNEMTYQEAERMASSFLEKIKENPQEARWLILARKAWTLTDWMTHQMEQMPQKERAQLASDLARKAKGEPLQYILGEAEFLNQHYLVTAQTLIPRPETEAWVGDTLKILSSITKSLDVLDIGTGSGVIGISHKLARPQDTVVATDISQEALAIAQKNARCLKADVEFYCGDLFEPVAGRTFDIIYSNPPYIGKGEITEMTANVIQFEPHEALFAAEEGYAIYRQIAERFLYYLNPGGQLYLEIGYQQAERVAHFIKNQGENLALKVLKDYAGHDRVIHVQML
ncbi:peptide chain release factor N(5)-glutamine methyltransferase [Allofustis seminis]|uniref:peptide chain release factor N(5)-glutamine methyltransferase n=1 Tax=Allofustis seminis TaxID=166939 RepID=UPI0003667B20|nr:peptide chain release factor N(5)-glutamine methyltransferase [Allofustis seminis]